MVNTKKLFKTALEGVVSSSLAATVLLSQLSLGVKAADLAPTKFISQTALGAGKYGLVAGKTLQKVYFGKNPHFDKTPENTTTPKVLESGTAEQGWYIAGYDSANNGLVLLCDPLQPMADDNTGDGEARGRMPFLAEGKYNSSTYVNKTKYQTSWGCDYSGSGFTPSNGSTEVYANHFGGSDIWAKVKAYGAAETRFTANEKALMKDTTVTTRDMKNSKDYTLTSKFYLGSGTNNQKRAKFGASDNLEVGLVASEAPEGANNNYTVSGNHFWLRSPHTIYGDCALCVVTGYYVGGNPVTNTCRCVPACALDLKSVIFASAAAPAAASSSALSDGVYLRVADSAETPKISSSVATVGNAVKVTKAAEGDAEHVYLYVQGNDGTNDWVYSKAITETEDINASDIHSGLENLENCKAWLETTDNEITYAKLANAGVATAPAAESLTYNGSAQTLVSAGTATNGTMQYKLGTDGTYSETIPTATNAGTYTVYYKAVGADDFKQSDEGSVDVTIAQKALSVTANDETVTYGDVVPTYTVLYDGFVTGEGTEDLSGELVCTCSYAQNSDVNTYTITPSGVTSDNYKITFTPGTLTVNKADITAITAPVAKTSLIYTGNAQELVNAGTATNGTMQYKVGEGAYSAEIPTATNVGTYKVYYKAVGDSNHNDSEEDFVDVTINKADINPSVTLEGWTVGDTASTPNVSGNSGNGVVTYSYKVSGAADSTYSEAVPTKAGNYTVKAEVPATTNYNAGTATADFAIKQRMYITLKNEYGGAITDVTGITLSMDNTELTHVANGVFKTEGLTVGNHTLTIAVDADSSSYSAPEVTTYTVKNDADHPSDANKPNRIIKLKQVVVKTGCVITGVGGDAGYKYDRKTGETVFYCNPAKGYKVDKIEKDSKGIVRYVKFKMV